MKTRNHLRARINAHRLALVMGCVMLSACLSSTDAPPNIPSDPTTETFVTGLGVDLTQMTKTSLGDYYKDISVGTGTTLTSQLNVVIDYSGYLKTGTLFESGQAIPFTLDGVIIGFHDGLIGMKVGGERLIVIPSALGFGPYPQDMIPSNSTLVFDVRLDSIP